MHIHIAEISARCNNNNNDNNNVNNNNMININSNNNAKICDDKLWFGTNEA